jgi:hypothetical protein
MDHDSEGYKVVKAHPLTASIRRITLLNDGRYNRPYEVSLLPQTPTPNSIERKQNQ